MQISAAWELWLHIISRLNILVCVHKPDEYNKQFYAELSCQVWITLKHP